MPVTGAPAATTTVTRPERSWRTVAVLVAGAVALVLALAGLTYALLDRGDGGSEANGGGGPLSSPARTGDDGSEGDGGTAQTDGRTASPTATDEEEENEESTPPPQTVSVTVTGAHPEYSGSCPPPSEEAPAFTATFTVGRVPAEVSYRWVAEDGSVADPGWRTLSFPEGGGRSKRDTVVVTTYSETGTYRSAIGVEVREPVRTASAPVPFSVTCEAETPTGGVSPSPSGSADGS
ncbi:hypothetical protein [Streptomyces griseoloalbus]|uniref:hypothetical protein n=1 Tax=Streptomyces griseoloalbus TaxID=67303 RepID=UPI003F541EB5